MSFADIFEMKALRERIEALEAAVAALQKAQENGEEKPKRAYQRRPVGDLRLGD